MRTRSNSIVTALVLLSLVSGAIGCKSNGGAWYKPNSYTWYNPFSSKDDPIPPYSGEHAATAKPSIGAQPNVAAPPGGYGDKAKEAEFYAAKPEKQVQPQYGNTITGGSAPTSTPAADQNRVAMADAPLYNGAPANYSTPNPYSVPDAYYQPNSGVTPASYQPTSIQQPNAGYQQPNAGYQQPAAGYQQPAAYQQPTGYQPNGMSPNPADYAPSATPSPYSPNTSVPATNYSPFAAQPEAQQGFGAPVSTTTAPAANAYGAGYTAAPSYGSGYPATPSTTGGF